jgi:hypothetical protein
MGQMKSVRDWLRVIARALELDRLFDGDTGFFVRHHRPAAPAEAAGVLPGRPEAPPGLVIRVGAPFISPTVSPLLDESPRPSSPFATSFIASWRPVPKPPEEWIQFLFAAPFGTQATSARELRWNGKEISVERVTESEIEAFVSKMGEWAEYANREFSSWQATPEVRANFEAQNRARQLQEKFRR